MEEIIGKYRICEYSYYNIQNNDFANQKKDIIMIYNWLKIGF